MLPRLSPANAPVSPSGTYKVHSMFTSSEGVFRLRQVLFDLSNSIHAGRDSILRFSVRAHLDAYPRLVSNGGRFQLPNDRDFYSDVLLAAAMPEDDFPAFTTATAILLMDLLQHGEGTDNLFWNWESFEGHFRLADPQVRASIMNGFRLGFEMGTVRPETPPTASDCLTLSKDKAMQTLIDADLKDVLAAMSSEVTAQDAGLLWETCRDARATLAFRYLFERPESLIPSDQEAAPLIPWT